MNITKKNRIQVLINIVTDYLRKQEKYIVNDPLSYPPFVVYDGCKNPEYTLEQIGIKYGDSIQIVYDIKDVNLREDTISEIKIKFIPNYELKAKPDWNILLALTNAELSKVKNFTLFNDFGEIMWENPVDIRGIDFSKEVSISEN